MSLMWFHSQPGTDPDNTAPGYLHQSPVHGCCCAVQKSRVMMNKCVVSYSKKKFWLSLMMAQSRNMTYSQILNQISVVISVAVAYGDVNKYSVKYLLGSVSEALPVVTLLLWESFFKKNIANHV